MSSKKQRLPGDGDTAAAFALADIAAPNGDYPPERVHADYESRLAEAGVNDESGFLLRSLTRRYVILETMYLQLARETADPMPPQHKNITYRNLSRLNEDMNKTLGLIHRVRLAQAENFAPFLTSEDKALADDARAEQHMQSKHGLTTLEMVLAEAAADDVVSTEFTCALSLPQSFPLAVHD